MVKSSAYHLMLSVSDGKVSKKFYDEFFKQIGWKTTYEDDVAAGYSDGKFTLWIVPAENKNNPKHEFKSVGFHHFAIKVDSMEKVDEMFQWAKQKNLTVVDEPKKYPEYSENYYATFFLDPDGMKLEITYN